MKYTGDTPAKKIARLVVWMRIKELLGKKFFTGKHLVLLSQEAGDVSTLLGLGVHPTHIFGADLDKHATAAAKHKFPDVACIPDDVAAVARHVGKPLVSAFLDYCSPMRESTLATAVEVVQRLEPGGVLAIAMKMGRELGEFAERVADAKAKVSVGSAAFYLRADMFTSDLMVATGGHGFQARPIDFLRYSSAKANGASSEMFVCIAQVGKWPKQSATSLAADAKKLARTANYESIVADERSIGPLASRLAGEEKDAHLLLNIQKTSIPPYKAHRTRGTYKDARPSRTRQHRKQ